MVKLFKIQNDRNPTGDFIMRSNRDFWILLFLILCSSSVYGQNLALSDTVAGIWINYDESLIGDYTLPDPLRMAHGEKVTSHNCIVGRPSLFNAK